MKNELQRKYMISELQNSTTGKHEQFIKIGVVLHKLTGVCLSNLESYARYTYNNLKQFEFEHDLYSHKIG